MTQEQANTQEQATGRTQRTRAEVEAEMERVGARLFEIEENEDPEGNGSPEEDALVIRDRELTEEMDAIVELERQADKYVWGPEDIEITKPEKVAEENTPETVVEMEQEDEAEPKKAIHHATKRGADMSLARREISQESHAAVLAGRISLAEARELGRNAGPDGPVGQSTKKATKKVKEPRPCLACDEPKSSSSLFHPGCDMKMYRIAREALDGERELTYAQREYLESSGKMAQVIAKREKDEAKRQAKIAAKAEVQRKREGEQEKQEKQQK